MAKTAKQTKNMRNAKNMKSAKKVKKTATKRREWTNEDVRQLKTLAKQKVGVARIAKTLKRTPGATTVKAHILGVSLSMRD